ncbi:hypothetical protein [Dendronalium sp. ChiSLP03b]|uniref:restriction endonuclease subunit S n=1 Tax=Dendronalium sp. ChiSLP03b TaxID=3075381 RepID=UPI002AD5264F|nr:hypothetical protein [Dendronalium sp. ChiSLP03b]MDZ8207457.1 hypothetical protein [Dendronalium sp. ChiSLP03b]
MLLLYLITPGTAVDEKEGSAQPNVNGQKLMKILVPMLDSEIQSAISKFLEVVRKRQDGSFEELPELPPPLEQQRWIMMRVEELVGKVEEVRSLRQKALIETEALLAASSTKFLNNTLINGQLSDILLNKPRNGWSARCNNMPQGIPVLSLGAITGFLYRETEFKRTSEPVLLDAHYWLKPGDLLITRSNTPELVGHAAIYNGFPYPCIYPDLMMRLEIDESKTDKHFVHHWLASTLVRDYIKSRAKGTSPTMKKISQEVVMNIPFPSDLSVCEQRRIVAYLDELQTKVDTMKRLREQAMKELDALLPSILNKAFKGEL